MAIVANYLPRCALPWLAIFLQPTALVGQVQQLHVDADRAESTATCPAVLPGTAPPTGVVEPVLLTRPYLRARRGVPRALETFLRVRVHPWPR